MTEPHITAIGVTTYGGPEALHALSVPREELGPEDVRLRVTAAAVSPTDTLRRAGMQDGKDVADPPGMVPGMDVAGEVLDVGTNVETGVKVGDHVMGIVVPDRAHGAYRADLVLPGRSVTLVPLDTTDEQAATVPMNALTARLALDKLALEDGQTLAVTGAAGMLGNYVIQLAKADGLRVVADAAEKDEGLLGELGVDQLVPRGDDVAAQIRRYVPDGVDGLVDASLQGEAVLDAVKDGGKVATVRGWDGGDQDRVEVIPVMVRDYAEEWEKLDRLREQIEAGELTPRVAGTVPAEQAAEAHRRLEAGGVRGRIVLTF